MKHSDTFTNIVKALVKSQSEFPSLAKEADNPFFHSKYADLGSMIDATQKILNANGIVVMQWLSTQHHEPLEFTVVTEDDNGKKKTVSGKTSISLAVETVLMHTSGEWIAEDGYSQPVMDLKPQTQGTAGSYARRYTYRAALSLAEVDDDGNAASGKQLKRSPSDIQMPQRKSKSAPKKEEVFIDASEVNELFNEDKAPQEIP